MITQSLMPLRNYSVKVLMKQKRQSISLIYVRKARQAEFVQKGVISKQGKLISSVQCSLNSVIVEEEVERSLFSL